MLDDTALEFTESQSKSDNNQVPFSVDCAHAAIGQDVLVSMGPRREKKFFVSRVEKRTQSVYVFKDFDRQETDSPKEALRLIRVPFDRIRAVEKFNDISEERYQYMASKRMLQDFTRADLHVSSIVMAPRIDDHNLIGREDTSVHNAIAVSAEYPLYKERCGYAIRVCGCGKHAFSSLFGMVSCGTAIYDVTHSTDPSEGCRMFVPDAVPSMREFLRMRQFGQAGVFDGLNAEVFNGPGNITFLPSQNAGCENGLRMVEVVHKVIVNGEAFDAPPHPATWEVSRAAIVKINDAGLTVPATNTARAGVRARMMRLGVRACRVCSLVDACPTAEPICGFCIGDIPPSAFEEMKARAAERERLEALATKQDAIERRLAIARSREEAEQKAARDVAQRIRDAEPKIQSVSKKKSLVSDRELRRQADRLTLDEIAHDVDRAPTYAAARKRDDAARKARKRAEAELEVVKRAIAAEKERVSAASARLEALKHHIPRAPTLADFVERAMQ